MKTSLLFIVTFFSMQISAQNLNATGNEKTDNSSSIDYASADNYALSITKKYTDVQALAKDLTKPFKTDAEKIRCVFRWMCKNITYDWKEYRNGFIEGRLCNIKFNSYEDYSYTYANIVLNRKKGTCTGYATLFYELCNESLIKCEMVSGQADANTRLINWFAKTGFFNCNHEWNLVKMDEHWYYADVTWACGEGGSFNPYYYLTPADQLYATHVTADKIHWPHFFMRKKKTTKIQKGFI